MLVFHHLDLLHAVRLLQIVSICLYYFIISQYKKIHLTLPRILFITAFRALPKYWSEKCRTKLHSHKNAVLRLIQSLFAVTLGNIFSCRRIFPNQWSTSSQALLVIFAEFPSSDVLNCVPFIAI